jgi:hypothetical protein
MEQSPGHLQAAPVQRGRDDFDRIGWGNIACELSDDNGSQSSRLRFADSSVTFLVLLLCPRR